MMAVPVRSPANAEPRVTGERGFKKSPAWSCARSSDSTLSRNPGAPAHSAATYSSRFDPGPNSSARAKMCSVVAPAWSINFESCRQKPAGLRFEETEVRLRRHDGHDRACEAVGFAARSGGEIKRRRRIVAVEITVAVAGREVQRPEPGYHDWLVAGTGEGAKEAASERIISVDQTVAEIPDQQRVAELTEVSRRERQPPGRIQFAVFDEAAHQEPFRTENVHEPVARPGLIVVIVRPQLLGEGHIEQAVDVPYVKRRETCRYLVIGKRSEIMEAGIEPVDPPVMEVGGVKKLASKYFAQGQSFVHAVGSGPIHHHHRR